MKWEDFSWNGLESSLHVRRIANFVRAKETSGGETLARIKNCKSKHLPVFRETFVCLQTFGVKKEGFIFQGNRHKILKYQSIANAYNAAFEKAGLPFSGTHVMRHARTREVIDNNNGDIFLAQQLLGNEDLASVLKYAKRSKMALTKVARRDWLAANQTERADSRSFSQKERYSKIEELGRHIRNPPTLYHFS